MVLVDTCVWIEAAERDNVRVKVALESLLEVNEAAICGVVKLEMLGTARPERRRPLENIFNVMCWLPMTDKLWHEAVQVSWHFRDRGHTFPWNDILIATIARHYGCRIYTLDKHFQTMSEIGPVILYRPGYGGSYNSGSE